MTPALKQLGDTPQRRLQAQFLAVILGGKPRNFKPCWNIFGNAAFACGYYVIANVKVAGYTRLPG